jgi:hypothetical protein
MLGTSPFPAVTDMTGKSEIQEAHQIGYSLQPDSDYVGGVKLSYCAVPILPLSTEFRGCLNGTSQVLCSARKLLCHARL